MGGVRPTWYAHPEPATGRLTPAAFGKKVFLNDTKLIEALSNTGSLEHCELSRIIDRLLADPRRIVAISNRVNLGKTVQFIDWSHRPDTHGQGGCNRRRAGHRA